MDLSVKEIEMKKIFQLIILSGFILLTTGPSVHAQCDYNRESQECISKVHDGFIYIKSFEIDGQNGKKEKVEYSYVMAKETQYYLNICTPGNDPDGIIVTIYDAQRNPVSTNYADGKFYEALIFQCNATGIYYISFTFNGSVNYCGGSALAFKK
jgi:hypothetical protein